MSTHQLTGTAVRTRPARASVMFEDPATAGLTVAPVRRRDVLLARLRGASLDRRLAGGAAPESSRLLATRARVLTSAAAREALAADWDALAARSHVPARGLDPRVPIARGRITGAGEEIRRVSDVLRSSRPVSAQGVAAASVLLTTADSPVYRTTSAGADLVAALARALESL